MEPRHLMADPKQKSQDLGACSMLEGALEQPGHTKLGCNWASGPGRVSLTPCRIPAAGAHGTRLPGPAGHQRPAAMLVRRRRTGGLELPVGDLVS